MLFAMGELHCALRDMSTATQTTFGRHRVCQNALDDIGGNNLVAEYSH
jgi:hypothetical protein